MRAECQDSIGLGWVCHQDPETRTDVGKKHGTVELINFTSREPSSLPKAATAR
jgi:hypothetical protein